MAKDFKWYTVWVGREPGVYNSWDDCQEQVENYPGAKYKSYTSKDEATAAFRGNYHDHIGIIKSIAQNLVPKKINYAAIPEIIVDSIAVDASCMGNPGLMEYRGVSVRTGQEIFRVGPFTGGTNNIGEFLALIHALALLKKQGSNMTIYSDSRTAISWLRNRKCKTTLTRNATNAKVLELLNRGIRWMESNEFSNRIIKWETEKWGEIPADFGRK